MILFIDIIAQAYIQYTIENDNDIAQYFYQEFYIQKEKSLVKKAFKKKRFYKSLINEIEKLIENSYNKAKEPDTSGIPYEFIDDHLDYLDFLREEYFKAMDQYCDDMDSQGIPYKFPNWEECTDGKKIRDAINNKYVVLKDPVNFITSNPDIHQNELVLRKSKLEYLRNEAIKARNANSVDELDLTKVTLNTKIRIKEITYQHSQSKNNLDIVQEKSINKAKEILKPLGGVYKLEEQLNNENMNRLYSYVESIIKSGKLPVETLKFNTISLPNIFIQKTFHLVYESAEKKYRNAFIELFHLFEQITKEPTTTYRHFSYYGKYDETLSLITY